MRPFALERPATPQEAVAAAAGGRGRFLGGGTNLVDLMKLGVETPERLVDVRRLTGTEVEETAEGGLRIGAAVPNSDLAAHPLVRERFPVVAQAVLAGASGQLRNLATTGGNLLQRTRCPYFQRPDKPCAKRTPGDPCSALEGERRDLAVLGHSASCIATHPSDLAVALAALDAEVHVLGPDGARVVPLVELHRLPGNEPHRDTVLAPDELVTAVELPPLPWAVRSAYRKARDRRSYAFALGSAAAALDLDGRTVRDVRLAFGALAHKPWRATRAEAALRGAELTEEAVEAAVDEELAAARPFPDNAFKLPLARGLAVAVLTGLGA